jgi:hypothetical protein
MSEVKSRPSNNRYREEFDRIFGVKEEKSLSLRDPRCKDCHWNPINSGCNVLYDEEQCKLNRRPKQEKI